MKYNVGDVLFMKKCEYKGHFHPRPHLLPRLHLRLRPRLRLHRQLRLRLRLNNTYGIITATEKHTDIFKENSTENDNGYIWYSQVDGKEYHFYEDEVEGEVVK